MANEPILEQTIGQSIESRVQRVQGHEQIRLF
jgi:hypothetical protein